MEDEFLDMYMEDFISAGYANPGIGSGWWGAEHDDYYDDADRWEEEMARGFDEAHARSEEGE